MKPRLKALVYVRDYFWDIYQNLFQGLEDYKLVQVTDFDGRGVEAINPTFHRHLAASDLPPAEVDEDDVIRRCRLLRNLPRAQALRMLRAMNATLLPMIRRERWTVILGQTVDDYITHLFALLAEAHGLNYLGFCSSYFPGYTQVTLSWTGAYAPGRTATAAEAEALLARVSGTRFRQDYNILVRYNRRVHYTRVARYWFKRAWFGVLRQARGTPAHIHYLLQPYLGQQKRLDYYPARDAFHDDWEQRWKKLARPAVYLPLGHTPEAGTDYMIRDSRYIDYEETILRIARALSRDFTVLVKDHFHMLGIRDPAFHAALRTIPGVVVVPPMVNSNALLSGGIDCVLVGAGSVGIEATIRQKTVFTFSDTAYWLEASRARPLRLDELEQWPEQIAAKSAAPASAGPFVEECLGTMLPFDYMIVTEHGGERGREVGQFLGRFLAVAAAPLMAPPR